MKKLFAPISSENTHGEPKYRLRVVSLNVRRRRLIHGRASAVGGVVAGILALMVSQTLGQLVQNGSFEAPAITPNDFQSVSVVGSPTSWAGGENIFNGNNGSVWPLPQDGNQFVDIGDVQSTPLSQPVTISTPGQYHLAWFDSSGVATVTSPYRVELFDQQSSTVVATGNFDANHPLTWTQESLQANLVAHTYTLTFFPLALHGSPDTLIDNVSLAPVPEPAALGVAVGLGLAVWGAVRRRSACRKD